jgi:phospholipid/cholesterol/gamma-HCH transport system substrate-binding protein
MENRAHAIAAGVFTLVLIVALAVGAFWLGGGTITGEPYDLITDASVVGLNSGDTVRLRGVEVGQVESIRFDASDPRLIRVRILVNPDVRVMEGTHGTIRYAGLSGSTYVDLDFPNSAVHLLKTSATAPATVPLSATGMAQLTQNAEDLMKAMKQTLQRVDGILTPETTKNIAQLVTRLNDASAAITTLTRDLQPAAHHIDSVITNANALLESSQSTVHDLDTLIVGANANGGAIDAIRAGALSTGQAAREVERALVHETLPRVDMLAERLSRTSDSLDQLLDVIQTQPQSFIFGLPRPKPGPGESGFQPTTRR